MLSQIQFFPSDATSSSKLENGSNTKEGEWWEGRKQNRHWVLTTWGRSTSWGLTRLSGILLLHLGSYWKSHRGQWTFSDGNDEPSIPGTSHDIEKSWKKRKRGWHRKWENKVPLTEVIKWGAVTKVSPFISHRNLDQAYRQDSVNYLF